MFFPYLFLFSQSVSTNRFVVQERNSVMLGEISPHHDYYDRESSSETPPSYNQLNYKENIQRFFQSNPVTTASDESVEGAIQMPTNDQLDQEGKAAVQPRNQYVILKT